MASTEEFEQADGSKDLMAPFMFNLYNNILLDPHAGEVYAGVDGVTDGRMLYNDFVGTLGPVMLPAIVMSSTILILSCPWGDVCAHIVVMLAVFSQLAADVSSSQTPSA